MLVHRERTPERQTTLTPSQSAISNFLVSVGLAGGQPPAQAEQQHLFISHAHTLSREVAGPTLIIQCLLTACSSGRRLFNKAKQEVERRQGHLCCLPAT